MVRETSLQALSKLCSERDSVLKDIVEFYGLVDATAQGVTARDRAKDLPIRILGTFRHFRTPHSARRTGLVREARRFLCTKPWRGFRRHGGPWGR